jgi:GTPase SAR1 family protein
MNEDDGGKSPSSRQKIVLLGDSGVGKTALAKRLSGNYFDPGEEETRGLTVAPMGPNREISIIDFPGNVSESDVRESFARESPSILLVVVDTFHNDGRDLNKYIERWLNMIPHPSGEGIKRKRFLVASRGDIVTQNRGNVEDLARRYGFDGTFLTSAKTSEGIQELRKGVLDAVKEDDEAEGELATVALVVRKLAERLCELVAKSPRALEEVEWRDLERLIATALEEIGFSVELTRSSKDQGKDVVATCVIENATKVFYVEIKHWRSGKRPGLDHISDFVEVNAGDGTDGGLFLSSSGYATPVYSRLGEISRQRVRLGQSEKIVLLCQQYVRKKRGVWSPTRPLPDTLFEETLG